MVQNFCSKNMHVDCLTWPCNQPLTSYLLPDHDKGFNGINLHCCLNVILYEKLFKLNDSLQKIENEFEGR